MPQTDVSRLLEAIDRGDGEAPDRLLPLVYDELRRMAAQKMAQERQGQTLQATALVHEAYMKLTGNDAQRWVNHKHFFAAAAEAMRRILIDQARKKGRIKHGGDMVRQNLDDLKLSGKSAPPDIIDLNEALEEFAQQYPDKAELVRLRYFAGMGLEEVAKVLNISRATASRHWTFARAWLFDRMNS